MTARLFAAAALVLALAGCSRGADGVAVSDAADETTGTNTAASPAPTGTTPTRSSSSVLPSPTEVPGVVTTVPDTMPPNALICMPEPAGSGRATQATVADPAAPRITLSVPDGWSSTPGQGDTALTLAGPDGISGEVTIAKTALDPVAAFTQYNDTLFARSAFSVVNTLPAEFCGFSSQRLFGTWADTPGQGIDFYDRITHVWTNTGNYLVTIHLQGPNKAAGLEAAKDTVLADFPIVIP